MSLSPGVHVWHRCHGCGAEPIRGARFDCLTCPAGPDNQLCASCHASFMRGLVPHPPPDSLAALDRSGRVHTFGSVEGIAEDRLAPWSRVADRRAAPPAVRDGSVVRPEFHTAAASFLGSYAFVVARDDAAPLAVTALHVMDELIKAEGIDASVTAARSPAEALPRVLRHVDLYDVYAPNWIRARVGSASPMLALPRARTGEEEPYCQSDVAAFVAGTHAGVSPMRLAPAGAEVGEPVWLAVNAGPRAPGRTLPAVVVERTPQSMVFRFSAGLEPPKYSSGAPILDGGGDVVGINVGGGRLDGRRYGHAVHVDSIRAHLRA